MMRNGYGRCDIVREIKTYEPDFCSSIFYNWKILYTPDLLTREYQLRLQQRYDDYKNSGKTMKEFCVLKHVSKAVLLQSVYFCTNEKEEWLKEYEREQNFKIAPIAMNVAWTDFKGSSVEIVDSLNELPRKTKKSILEQPILPPEVPEKSEVVQFQVGKIVINIQCTSKTRNITICTLLKQMKEEGLA